MCITAEKKDKITKIEEIKKSSEKKGKKKEIKKKKSESTGSRCRLFRNLVDALFNCTPLFRRYLPSRNEMHRKRREILLKMSALSSMATWPPLFRPVLYKHVVNREKSVRKRGGMRAAVPECSKVSVARRSAVRRGATRACIV